MRHSASMSWIYSNRSDWFMNWCLWIPCSRKVVPSIVLVTFNVNNTLFVMISISFRWTPDVMITSLSRQNDVATLFWPNNDFIIASGVRQAYKIRYSYGFFVQRFVGWFSFVYCWIGMNDLSIFFSVTSMALVPSYDYYSARQLILMILVNITLPIHENAEKHES